MVKHLIGYRFSPTGVELVNHYLKNKNLGNTCLVDEAISEINILSYEPKFLPRLAKIQSDDLKWYFFSRIEYTNAKKNAMKRSTGSGFWKPTGKDRIIRDKRTNGVEIGLKKTLVYHERKALNGVRTDWVMHEYHITCLPHDQRTYVICQVMYKDEDGDIPSGGNYSTEPSQSLVSDSNTIRVTSIPPVFQVEQQPGQDNYYGLSENDLRTPLNEQADLSECDGFDPNTFLNDNNNVQQQDDGEFMCGLPPAYRGTAQHLLPDQDSIMQEYNNDMLMSTATATISTASEFEQPGQENVYGLSADDLIMIPMNEQYDLCPWDVLDPKMSFCDNNNPTVQPQAPHLAPDDDEFLGGLRHVDRGQVEYLCPNEEFISRLTTSMTENRNDHRPKKPLSGIIYGYSSDSDTDAESISAMSYQGTSSPGHSVGSPNMLQDEQSLKDAPAAYRTAAEAAARIQGAFREKALKAAWSSVIQFANKEEAAYWIQCRFQTWKMRREYLNMRRQAIRIQAAFRGLQARRQYKKIIWSVGLLEKAVLRWRQKRKGFTGLQVAAEEDSPGEAEEDFYKTSQRQAEERLERSVLQVQAMFRSKKAQADYRRMKLTHEEAQVKHGTPRAIDVSIMKTEKKGWFITEEAMERNHKNPWYIYLMRMIIGFILLMALIGNNILATTLAFSNSAVF